MEEGGKEARERLEGGGKVGGGMEEGGREGSKREGIEGEGGWEIRRRYGQGRRREKEGKSSLASLGVICQPLHSS